MNAHSSDVLVIEHETDCPPGLLAEVLAEADLTMHRCRPYRGDQLPADLSGFEALVVLGGGMCASDDENHSWLPRARRLLALAAERHLPTLGVCLGAQLAALALEGRTGRRDDPAVGPTPVVLTAAGEADPVLSVLGGADAHTQPCMLSWNQDTVTELPPHSTLLARDPEGHIAAFRTGTSLWAVQFHPEATAEIIEQWARTSELTPTGTTPEQIAERIRSLPEVTERGRALLEAFAAQVITG